MTEPADLRSWAYERWVTRLAAEHGCQEKDLAWNVAYRAALLAQQPKEQTA